VSILQTTEYCPKPAVEILDEDSIRADLARRCELKYLLQNPDLEALRKLMDCNGRRQVFNRQTSGVHSVYFDDFRLSSCKANLEGIGHRQKLRVRWYDTRLPRNECYIEIKWRESLVTGKHRLRLRCDNDLGEMTYREIYDLLCGVMPEKYLPTLLMYCEPTLLVQYRREHFVSPDGRMRVTLDYDMVYYDQTGKQRISTCFGKHHQGFAVLEGKIPVDCENKLRSFIYPFAGRFLGCSKYVHGCRMCGLI
jgi:hypothetical protein